MNNYLTFAEAFSQFSEAAGSIPADDTVMLSKAWNDYTDRLYKDGQLTSLQYYYCPAVDEVGENNTETDDVEFLLDSMGVEFTCNGIGTDNTGRRSYDCTITRGSKSYAFPFHMGSACGEPDIATVLPCLFLDAGAVEWEGSDLAVAGDNMDNAGLLEDVSFSDACKTIKACMNSAKSLSAMFTQSERDDLQELFSDWGL